MSALQNEVLPLTVSTENGVLIESLIGLYHDKLGSCLRELICNGLEAENEKRKLNPDASKQRVEVDITPDGFSVLDHGVGLSYEVLRDNYRVFGATTKLDTENSSGRYGFGAKSPLCLSLDFFVESANNGVLRKCKVSMKEGLVIFETLPTKLNNYTKVTVPCNYSRHSYVRALRYFKLSPMAIKVVYRDDQEEICKSFQTEIFAQHKKIGPVVVIPKSWNPEVRIGEVVYQRKDYYAKYNVVCLLPAGSVQFTPSREEPIWEGDNLVYSQLLELEKNLCAKIRKSPYAKMESITAKLMGELLTKGTYEPIEGTPSALEVLGAMFRYGKAKIALGQAKGKVGYTKTKNAVLDNQRKASFFSGVLNQDSKFWLVTDGYSVPTSYPRQDVPYAVTYKASDLGNCQKMLQITFGDNTVWDTQEKAEAFVLAKLQCLSKYKSCAKQSTASMVVAYNGYAWRQTDLSSMNIAKTVYLTMDRPHTYSFARPYTCLLGKLGWSVVHISSNMENKVVDKGILPIYSKKVLDKLKNKLSEGLCPKTVLFNSMQIAYGRLQDLLLLPPINSSQDVVTHIPDSVSLYLRMNTPKRWARQKDIADKCSKYMEQNPWLNYLDLSIPKNVLQDLWDKAGVPLETK